MSEYIVKCVLVYLVLLISQTNARSYRKSNNTGRNLFPLSLIHINDFHARYWFLYLIDQNIYLEFIQIFSSYSFDEMNLLNGDCKHGDVCIGGYARIVTVVKRLQQTRSNSIYFNAGDNFVGTILFMIGKRNITSYFLNQFKADVMVSG